MVLLGNTVEAVVFHSQVERSVLFDEKGGASGGLGGTNKLVS